MGVGSILGFLFFFSKMNERIRGRYHVRKAKTVEARMTLLFGAPVAASALHRYWEVPLQQDVLVRVEFRYSVQPVDAKMFVGRKRAGPTTPTNIWGGLPADRCDEVSLDFGARDPLDVVHSMLT
jgi:hypothetical protein